jgi:uridine phosphorylase
LYIGSITAEDGRTKIPVASMTSHMGFSSLEIAVTEIAAYGPNIETIIRVGSSGAMSEDIKAGDVVAANDASYSFLTSLSRFIAPWHRITIDDKVNFAVKNAAARITKEEDQQHKDQNDRLTVHYGTTYSKDRLYEDEFLTGPLVSQVYHAFVKAYKAARGHSNSEMETAELYLLTERLKKLYGTKIRVGSLNLVIGEVKGVEEIGYIPDAVRKGMPKLYQLIKYTTQELAK